MPKFRAINRQLSKRGILEDSLAGGPTGLVARGLIGADGTGDYSMWHFGGSSSGVQVTSASMLTITAVFQAVNLYCNTIAALDFYVARGNPRGGHVAAPDHPAYVLVHSRPNSYTTSFNFRRTLIMHALCWGNGYAEIVWDATGRRPLSLHLIDPRTVQHRNVNGRVIYQVSGGAQGVSYLDDVDVLHVSQLGFDGITGYSPARLFGENLGLAKAREQYQAALYGNNAVPSGYLRKRGAPNAVKDAQLREEWESVHRGAGNAGKMALLAGDLEWVPTQHSPEALGLNEALNFSIADVARIYNIPQHMLGVMDRSTFSNIEQQQIQFYTLSLLPWLTHVEQECEAKLFGPIERGRYFVKHNISSLLRGDMAGRAAYHTAMFNIGVLSHNEIRVEDGLNPRDDPAADYHWVPVNNLQAVELMGATQVEEPASELDPDSATGLVVPPPDPEPPTPAPGGTILDTEGLTALRAALADPIGRMVRREAQAARKAARRDALDFDRWYREFLPAHQETVTAAIAPTVRLAAETRGLRIDPATVAAELVAESAERYRGLVASVPPDELPGAVGRACDEWEAGDARARSVADRLLDGDPSVESRNCGIGPHGFSAGNKCAKGGGGKSGMGGGVPAVNHAEMAEKVQGASARVADNQAVEAARDGDAKQFLAAKGIDRHFPARDTSPPDLRYEHGGPKSAADHEHLAQAEKAGAVAMHVKTTPKESVVPGGGLPGSPVGGVAGQIGRENPGSKHRLVAGKAVATIFPTNPGGGDDKHTLVRHFDDGGKTTHEVSRHKSADGAERSAARHAGSIVRDQTENKRQLVKRPDQYDPAEHATAGKHHTTTFRVIERAEVRAESRNCGTGAGGFHAGNHCAGGGGGHGGGGGGGAIDHEAGRAAMEGGQVEHQRFHKLNTPAAATYQHGPPETPADQRHAEKATAKGRVAVVVESTQDRHVTNDHGVDALLKPGHGEIPRGLDDARHHVVGGDLTATAYRDEKGRHRVDTYTGLGGFGVQESFGFKSKEAADKKAEAVARGVQKEWSSTTRTTAKDVAKFDYFHHMDGRFGHSVKFRVIDPPG